VCLILFAWQSHPRYSLVLAANRDEFHQRPTADADFWDEQPEILGGRDLQAGGTWLGVGRGGRFAAITNYREPSEPRAVTARSRGHFVGEFLAEKSSPMEYAAQVKEQGSEYEGFNLLLGHQDALAWVSNRSEGVVAVDQGVHGLSNHLLDTRWPKVQAGRDSLQSLLGNEEVEADALFDLLTDRALVPGRIPEHIEKHLAPERMMNHNFIVSPVYGTRSSTILLLGRDGSIYFSERQFNVDGQATGTRRFLI
jgi:uncharacterized protein with NRDE domain